MTAETSNARGEAMIAGALFDFLGYLTTRDEPAHFGASFEASPAVELLSAWANTRGLSLDEARVKEWRDDLAAAPPPAAARGDVRDVLEKAQWGLYVAWDAVAALEGLQKRGVYAPRCADGKPSRADAGKDLEVIKAAYETVKQALAAEGVQAGDVVACAETACAMWTTPSKSDAEDAAFMAGFRAALSQQPEARVYQCPRCATSMEVDPTAKPEARGVVDVTDAMVERAWLHGELLVGPGGSRVNFRNALITALAQQPEARGVVDELRRTVAAIGVVGEYLGKDTILRESVLDLIDRRLTALTEARNVR